ncbi:alpha/beta fold hydrolase [Polyangium sp. 6x1]|uniref:alpha/beta fold hydrolase n=1 Tax=Polyangium sp. 6x1 TaxID=3042689 RepID=UPI00248261D3|nr:alpha/beta fold hydrolase [Polyangium sp. 6x1]MDI1443377.1 alpha/beta fold hydrolase [Polyangium sp. 6x1]
MSFWYRVGLLMTLTACQGPSVPPATPGATTTPTATPAGVMDELVDIGGLSLHIHCIGKGIPVVVLDSGLGDDGGIWSEVQPELGRFTRACAYDRAGTGESSAAPRPHTSRQMVRELHTLLGRAGIAGPYVLVGHSLGGLNVRFFASEHPREVVGMVLVDATTEEQDTRFWSLIPEEDMRGFRTSLADHPEGLDFDAFLASMADVRNSKRSLGDMPLVVLTHGKEGPPPGGSAELGAQMARVWREMQSELPRLSSNSVHFTAVDSGHYIHKDAPRLVVAAIQEVVRAVRTHARVEESTMHALPHGGSP